MTTVQQLLREKPQVLWTIHPDQTVYEAIKIMADKDIGALLVMQSGLLCGIVTERHYARNVVLKGKTSLALTIREIMDRNVGCVELDDSAERCMAQMTEQRVRHLAVVRMRRVMGILSIGDLVKSIITEQRHTIHHLERYINGQSAFG